MILVRNVTCLVAMLGIKHRIHFELLIAHVTIIEIQHLIRYILIILIGFFPLFSLLKISNLKIQNILFLSKFKVLLIPFIFTFYHRI